LYLGRQFVFTNAILSVGRQPVAGIAQTLVRTVRVRAFAVPAKARLSLALVHVRAKCFVRRDGVSRLALAQVRAGSVSAFAVKANPRIFVTLVDVCNQNEFCVCVCVYVRCVCGGHKTMWPTGNFSTVVRREIFTPQVDVCRNFCATYKCT